MIKKGLILLAIASLGGVSLQTPAVGALAENSVESGTGDSSETSETSKIYAALEEIWTSGNYTLEWEYGGKTYRDVYTPNYSVIGGGSSGYVLLPSVDGAYQHMAYNAPYTISANGVKNITLGTPLVGATRTFLPGDANMGANFAVYQNPVDSIDEYNPLSETNRSMSFWADYFTEDKIVDLGFGDGTLGCLGYTSTATSVKGQAAIYLTTCAVLGFYRGTSNFNAIYVTGRFYQVADANSYSASSRPYAVSFDFDEYDNLVASVWLEDDDGTYYVPDGGTGTFKDIGTSSDIDFDEFMSEATANVSKKSLSREQAAPIIGREFSSTTTVTTVYDTMSGIVEQNPVTYYLDYNDSYLRSYSEDNMEGNLYCRESDGSASFVLLTGDNKVEHYNEEGDMWLDWMFAYEFMDLGSWRLNPVTGTYFYYGLNADSVYTALTGCAVPGIDSSTSFDIVSLEISLENGVVSHMEATTSTISAFGPDGSVSYLYCVSEVDFDKEPREIKVPTPFERDESYDTVKAAFDSVNDVTKPHKTVKVEYFTGVNENNALHIHSWFTPDVVYIENRLQQESGYSDFSAMGYYLKKDSSGNPLGIIRFERDWDTGAVEAAAPIYEGEGIEDYWDKITANPDIMTFDSNERTLKLKGNVHLLPSYFPTISGDDEGEEDSVSNLKITLNEDGTISKIDYNAGASITSYGTFNTIGRIDYYYGEELPEGLLDQLAAMPEWVTPESWSESAYGADEDFMEDINSFLEYYAEETGEVLTVEDLPYVYDEDWEEGGYSSFWSSYSHYFYTYANSGDWSELIAAYETLLAGEGYVLTDDQWVKGRLYVEVRPYSTYSGTGFRLEFGVTDA